MPIPRILAALTLCTALTANAQSAPAPAGSNWSRVQALPPGTGLHINGLPHTTCTFASADADNITCSKSGGKSVTYARAGIKSIKLTHRLRSTLVGTGIGAGTGAIFGFAVGTDHSHGFFGDNAFRGAITLFFGTIGAVVGTPIGALTDFTAGSAIYKAP